jgi:hypothetical protein
LCPTKSTAPASKTLTAMLVIVTPARTGVARMLSIARRK